MKIHTMRTTYIVIAVCALGCFGAIPAQAHWHRPFFGLFAPRGRPLQGTVFHSQDAPAYTAIAPTEPPPFGQAAPRPIGRGSSGPQPPREPPSGGVLAAEALPAPPVPAVVAAAAAGKTVEVGAYDDYFQPATITIELGTTVRWANLGQHAHTIKVYDNTWESDDLEPRASFAVTFQQPGIYSYFCRHHALAGMTGTIIVTDAAGRHPANGRTVH